MKAYLVAITLLINLTGKAQYNAVGPIPMWADGYVVTEQNDTIRGQVRIGSTINDSPTSVVVRAADNTKIKLKGDDLRLFTQRIPGIAHSTGFVPRDREMVVFERVPNPRRKDKTMLLERLTPAGGVIALYFDATGWKKSAKYSSGNSEIETNPEDLSYIALKNESEAFIAKRGEMEAVYERLFGDCPQFMRNNPTATRRDWKYLGDMVSDYNRLCQHL